MLNAKGSFNEWEMEKELIGIIRGKEFNTEEKDKMLWKANKEGSYTVESNMDQLEGGRGAVLFPKRLVWNELVPTKVGLFVWEA